MNRLFHVYPNLSYTLHYLLLSCNKDMKSLALFIQLLNSPLTELILQTIIGKMKPVCITSYVEIISLDVY